MKPKKNTLEQMPIRLKPSGNQEMVINAVRESVLCAKEDDMGQLVLVKSGPGSGKTSTIIESIMTIAPYVNVSEDEKILVLAFNAKMKDEIEKKLKKSGIDLRKVEIRTIHSLFFKHTWRFTQGGGAAGGGTFKVDFTKSFFSKKMIKQVLESLVSGDKNYDAFSESVLEKDRIFSSNICSDKNIEILYRYINAYYSSPYPATEFSAFSKMADFFAKGTKEESTLRLTDVELSEFDINAIIEKFPNINKGNTDPRGLFFLMVAKRIDTLAKIKVMQEGEVISTKSLKTLVAFEKVNKDNGAVIEHLGETEWVFNIDKKNTSFHHIFEVPHNYYYKEFLRNAFSSDEFINSVFGDYKAIFVDEAQDNDMIFFYVLSRVLQKKICPLAIAVGDPHQGIYAFKSPDHFDILGYCEKNSESLAGTGIAVQKLPLSETYRFGSEIATFCNMLFPESTVIGKLGHEGFVANTPLSLEGQTAAQVVKSLAARKDLKVGIVCRSNSEAINIHLSLARQGCDGAALHSNIKSDYKDFLTKGISGINDEVLRTKLSELLSNDTKKKEFSYDDVLKNDKARSLLVSHGYGQLVRYSKDDIERHILAQDRKRKNVTITTAHQAKGAEFDYVIVAGDYFRKNLESKLEHEIAHSQIEFQDPSKFGAFASMLGGTPANLPKSPENQEELAIQELISDPNMTEERNTLYVAITRAKKGVFFMDGPLFESIKPIIEASGAWMPYERIAKDLIESTDNFAKIAESSEENSFNEDAELETDILPLPDFGNDQLELYDSPGGGLF